jgi:hypothetical protein
MPDLIEGVEFIRSDEAEGFTRPPDPEPGRKPRSRARKTAASAAPPKITTAAARREAKDFFQFSFEMGAQLWGAVDEVCAPVLAQQAEPMADALANILARYPSLLGGIRFPALMEDVVKFLMAAFPVVATARMHHARPRDGEPQQPPMPNAPAFVHDGFPL